MMVGVEIVDLGCYMLDILSLWSVRSNKREEFMLFKLRMVHKAKGCGRRMSTFVRAKVRTQRLEEEVFNGAGRWL